VRAGEIDPLAQVDIGGRRHRRALAASFEECHEPFAEPNRQVRRGAIFHHDVQQFMP